MYQVFKPTILNSHSLWLMESQSKSTAKPQSLRQAPVHCDSISKLPVITSRCKSTCTSCFDLVSIQRAAWYYQEGLDVLKYSYQNGGGSRAAVKEIKSNRQFQKFLLEKCTPDL